MKMQDFRNLRKQQNFIPIKIDETIVFLLGEYIIVYNFGGQT